MINLCDCCRALNAAPRRSDVPLHLKRVDEGLRQRGFHFECVVCSTPWSWSVSRGWHAKWDESVLLEGVCFRAPPPRMGQQAA
jgi:hypothetical protein